MRPTAGDLAEKRTPSSRICFFLRTGREFFSDIVMIYHDISIPIHAGMHIYEGDPPVDVSPVHSIQAGDLANVSRLLIGSHTGTHVDAPCHFIDDGKTVDEISLEILIGPARVVELTNTNEISREALISAGLEGQERVLFKTSNSRLWRENGFQKEFVHITGAAAEYLVEIDVKLVGIDYLSADRFGADDPIAHNTLLGAGVVIVEGLDISKVKQGDYDLICLPLLVRDGDGAPCRVVLVERQLGHLPARTRKAYCYAPCKYGAHHNR